MGKFVLSVLMGLGVLCKILFTLGLVVICFALKGLVMIMTGGKS
jgi:hypothetical protein